MIQTNKDTTTIPLTILGWDSHFQRHLDTICKDNIFPARVVGVHKNHFLISQGKEECLVKTAGRLNHRKKDLYPVIGDWVIASGETISAVLPRKTVLSRGAAGTHGKQGDQACREQIIAANLDMVFIVCGMDHDFNLRRIERYLTLVYNCGLSPVIVLTKSDLHESPESFVEKVEEVAFGVPVHPVSENEPSESASLEPYISQGMTIAMIGSSGAGKSTLINRLYGKEIQETSAISKRIGKGRHTTTHRSLIMMPQGGMVIDNPGIREIGFGDAGDGLDSAFPEIEAHAGTCRFHNCSHTHEPDCSVLKGLEDGTIRQDRLNAYQKMKRELAYLSDRSQKSADRVEKERWQGVALKIKAMNKRQSYE